MLNRHGFVRQKWGESRRQPASPQLRQDRRRRPDRCLHADSRHRRRRRYHSRTDTADHSTYHHQASTSATDNRDHAITKLHETSCTAFFSRIATVEKAKDQVTGDDHCANPVLSYQRRGWVPSARKVRAPGCHLNEVEVRAARLPREDEDNDVDLPAFFVYHRDNKYWTLVKGPISKFHGKG